MGTMSALISMFSWTWYDETLYMGGICFTEIKYGIMTNSEVKFPKFAHQRLKMLLLIAFLSVTVFKLT